VGGNERDGEQLEHESWTEVEGAPPATSEPEAIRPGSVLAGRYVVEAIIGRGGMGVVVRAHDRTLDAQVAIKIVRAELANERYWAERLAREVKLARQIQHPNVCRVFDFEQADGRVFLVMELATGGTLREEMAARSTGARALGETLADARAVAAGLAAIHDAGIVHRDLSPQNLLRMGDGRLVLSDFGLATDPSETTTSIRGGTIAYMAPEIVRGGKAGFASDIWALGVVVHEMVFGTKPTWKGKRGTELVAPAIGRPLSRTELAVLGVCRGCLASEPGRRPMRAGQVTARLTEAALARPNWRRWGVRAGVAVCAAAAAALSPAAVKRLRRRAVATAANAASPLLDIVGEPADWTSTSRVLGEIPDRVRCVVPLPDHDTVRLVWGRPPHAEDLDTKTGRRVPSPIVPDAYAEGCPDLSSDGKQLVYQGHTGDGRAFAFVAENPEGRDAVAVVPTAEPSHLSDPRWLGDGRTFSYDIDLRHIGIYSVETKRSTVVPSAEFSGAAIFRWTTGNTLFVGESLARAETLFVGFDGDTLTETTRFRVPLSILNLVVEAPGRYLGVSLGTERTDSVVELQPERRLARRVGFIPGQHVRSLSWARDRIFFASRREKALVKLRAPGGGWSTAMDTDVTIESVADCGGDLLTVEWQDGAARVVRRGRTGQMIRALSDGPHDISVSCSRNGRWFYVRGGRGDNTVVACDGDRCRDLMRGKIWRARVSADGTKLALLSFENRGATVSWVDVSAPTHVHVLRETETLCSPTWSSTGGVWISRRQGRSIIWTEVEITSGAETGRRQPGTEDCTNGDEDPTLPGEVEVRLAYEYVTQFRVISPDAVGD
jgi:hypothetical protein